MNKKELKNLYERGKEMQIMMQAKPREGIKYPSLIDLDAVKEMLEFEDFILDISAPVPDPSKSNTTEARFGNICKLKEMVEDIERIRLDEAC